MSTSTASRFFLDTNIAVYCFDSSAPRKQNCHFQINTICCCFALPCYSTVCGFAP